MAKKTQAKPEPETQTEPEPVKATKKTTTAKGGAKTTKASTKAPVKATKPAKSTTKAATAKSATAKKPAKSKSAPAKKTKAKTESKVKTKSKSAVKAKKEQVEGEVEEKKGRHFKCVYNGETFGRFSGNKPKQAANKALTSLVKTHNIKNEILFSIVECTRGSKRKVHNYRGKRVKLETPMIVQVGKGDNQKQITYNFNNDLHKLKANEAVA